MILSPGEIGWIREKGQLRLSALSNVRARSTSKRVELFDGWRVPSAAIVTKAPTESDLLHPINSHFIQSLDEALQVQVSYPHIVLTVSDARRIPDLRPLCTKACFHVVTKPSGIKPFGRTIESFDWSLIPSQVHGVQNTDDAFFGHDQELNADFYRSPKGTFRVVYSPALGDYDEFVEPGKHVAQKRCAAIARLRCRPSRIQQ